MLHLPDSAELRHGDTREWQHGPIAGVVTDLIAHGVVLNEEWEELPQSDQLDILCSLDKTEALAKLLSHRLLTAFQHQTIVKGAEHDLVLGHYRLLEPIGRGGMGVVYRGENNFLRRQVAIKVIANAIEPSPRMLHRFYAEARSVARLQHPNIAACLDGGRHVHDDGSTRDFYVMELVNGQDLDATIRSTGPLPVAKACELFRLIAEALTEAHRFGLVHRDIKPSNILVTPSWQPKLLDFGLALHPRGRVTDPGTVLGTLGFMAPEQARAAQTVDARADIFSLGATLYWALTGQEPFLESGEPIKDLHRRLTAAAPQIRCARPDLPEELCLLVDKMMAVNPDERPQSARIVAITLAGLSRSIPRFDSGSDQVSAAVVRPRIVIVDDEPAIRKLIRYHLEPDQDGQIYDLTEAADGEELLDQLQRRRVDLVILDLNLPGVSGQELIQAVKGNQPLDRQPKVLLLSGVIPPESLRGLMAVGADDFMVKPLKGADLRTRVDGLLAERRGSAEVNQERMTPTAPGRHRSTGRPSEVAVNEAQSLGILGGLIAEILHEALDVRRTYGAELCRYIHALAAVVPADDEYTVLQDGPFLKTICEVAALHDIGHIAIPKDILRKPGSLDRQERMIVEMHPVLGAAWLTSAATVNGVLRRDMQVAVQIIRSHHERWDGQGYPDGLVGASVPLAARVVGVVSAYCALRTRRADRPALSHRVALEFIASGSGTQFDPVLASAVGSAEAMFARIHEEISQ
jgi:eukaryotic-like serine/threonine-protein kinase